MFASFMTNAWLVGTVVALLAAAAAAEAGKQAALMAPTEILARQHLKTIAPLAAQAGLAMLQAGGNAVGSVVACLVDVWLGHLAASHLNQLKGA